MIKQQSAALWLMCALLLSTSCSPGEEAASFNVDGDTAVMSGVIGSSTPDLVRDLIADYPTVTMIVMLDVPGSEDDESNLVASRLVRQAGLATHVPSDGMIASGGVDFFLAGAHRSWGAGAKFGVHSWSDGETEGVNVDADSGEHDLFLDYYAEMGIDEEFYWFTLQAAPADDIHYMTEDELERYRFRSRATG